MLQASKVCDDAPEVRGLSAEPKGHRAQCSCCALRGLCMASCLDDDHVGRLEAVVSHWRMVHRGERLFRAGDRFQCLYAVRSGSIKTVIGDARGGEHVTGFYMVGETLGLGAISTDAYDCDAIALEDSAVCVIPFTPMEALCRELRPLQHHFLRLLSTEIVRESRQMMLLSGMTAEQRVAAFLVDLSERLRRRGYSPHSFTLRMTREEIGNYLGIKLETVSRAFSRFQREGLLHVDGKCIELFDVEAMAMI